MKMIKKHKSGVAFSLSILRLDERLEKGNLRAYCTVTQKLWKLLFYAHLNKRHIR